MQGILLLPVFPGVGGNHPTNVLLVYNHCIPILLSLHSQHNMCLVAEKENKLIYYTLYAMNKFNRDVWITGHQVHYCSNIVTLVGQIKPKFKTILNIQ